MSRHVKQTSTAEELTLNCSSPFVLDLMTTVAPPAEPLGTTSGEGTWRPLVRNVKNVSLFQGRLQLVDSPVQARTLLLRIYFLEVKPLFLLEMLPVISVL